MDMSYNQSSCLTATDYAFLTDLFVNDHFFGSIEQAIVSPNLGLPEFDACTYRHEQPKNVRKNSGSTKTESRRPHYEVEKRYRSALNDGFRALQIRLMRALIDDEEANSPEEQRFLATLREWKSNAGSDGSRQNKSGVLQAAIDYIKWLQARCEAKNAEVAGLEEAIVLHGHRLSTALNL